MVRVRRWGPHHGVHPSRALQVRVPRGMLAGRVAPLSNEISWHLGLPRKPWMEQNVLLLLIVLLKGSLGHVRGHAQAMGDPKGDAPFLPFYQHLLHLMLLLLQLELLLLLLLMLMLLLVLLKLLLLLQLLLLLKLLLLLLLLVLLLLLLLVLMLLLLVLVLLWLMLV